MLQLCSARAHKSKKDLLSLETDHHPHHHLHNIASTCSRHSSWTTWLLKMGRICRPDTSVATNQRRVTSQKSEDFNYTAVEPWYLSTENILPPPSFEPRTIQRVASRSTDYGISTHKTLQGVCFATAERTVGLLIHTRVINIVIIGLQSDLFLVKERCWPESQNYEYYSGSSNFLSLCFLCANVRAMSGVNY
jgi:hypothetical protein